MEGFTLTQAAEWTNGEARGNANIREISIDTRKIPEGAMFIAIKGENFDGHNFIGKAVECGAGAVVSHRKDEEYPVPTLYVADTSKALLDIARGYRELCGGKVVAVTGSVGKTTTKELLYSVLSEYFDALKTEGNFNNEIGVPLTLFRMTKETEVMVSEMGMNHFGELSRISNAARPDIAVITNIGTSHIEFLGSREGICKAKLEVLEGMPKDGIAVFCGDEPLLWEKRKKVGHKVYTYGIKNPECDIIGRLHKAGTFDIINNSLPLETLQAGEKLSASLNVPGEHNVLNALAAALVGLVLGENPEDIVSGLSLYKPGGMRQNIYEKGGFHIYADCYNASPEAMESTLKVLATMPGRRFAVLGSMLELGDYTEKGHRLTGGYAAENADALYAYGPSAVYMAEGAKERGMEDVHVFEDHEALASMLRAEAKKGDSLLFKGSRGMKMEKALELFSGEGD